MKRAIAVLIIFVTVIGLAIPIYQRKDRLFVKYDPLYWQIQYAESNWVKGWDATTTLSDEELYAYASYRQIKGDDPVLINPEMPPLAKYIIGFSIVLFQNQYLISILIGVVLFVSTYMLALIFIKNKTWALLPVALLSLDKLFQDNILTSMIDLPYALFITLSFYFFIKGHFKRYNYALAWLFLACVSGTKMYMVGFAIGVIWLIYLAFISFFYRRNDLFYSLKYLVVFILVYLGIYMQYFLHSHSLVDFKIYHFWIRHFARVQVTDYPKFEILRILLLGKWHTWWGQGAIESVAQWSILWPLSFILTIIKIFTQTLNFKKSHLPFFVLSLWIFSLLGMFSYGVSYPRYILPLIPALYINLVSMFKLLPFEKNG